MSLVINGVSLQNLLRTLYKFSRFIRILKGHKSNKKEFGFYSTLMLSLHLSRWQKCTICWFANKSKEEDKVVSLSPNHQILPETS